MIRTKFRRHPSESYWEIPEPDAYWALDFVKEILKKTNVESLEIIIEKVPKIQKPMKAKNLNNKE